MSPVRNNEQNMNNQNKPQNCESSISNGMKKLSLLAPILLTVFFVTPLFATAQEITCSPPCGQGYTCDSLQGVCVASQPTSGGTNTTSGFVPLAPIPGLTQGVVADSNGLANFLNNLYKYLIGLAAVIAIIQIIWAGIDIAFFHKDAVSAITDDKGKIYNAIFGLVLVLSPALVFSIINPSILNLSLNLPPLDTTPRGVNTSSVTPDATPPAADTSMRIDFGVQTMAGFTIADTLTLPEVRNALNAKQAECTQKSNNLGFIVPPLQGTNVYTCQTCPSGTTLKPQSARDAITPLGTCVPN